MTRVERSGPRRDQGDDTGNAVALELDLSSLASVREFAAAFNKRYSTLDVLVNNAAASLRAREITADGFERHWATNVLGPHLLTKRLLPALEAGRNGRIVTVSMLAWWSSSRTASATRPTAPEATGPRSG